MNTDKIYNGELDHLTKDQCYKLGVDARISEKEVFDSNPTSHFIWNEKNEKKLEFIDDNFLAGWFDTHRNLLKDKTELRFKEFKENIPCVGDTGFIEFDSNLGNYFECKVVFVTDDNDAFVIEYTKNNDGYALLGRGSHLMGKLHKSKPE